MITNHAESASISFHLPANAGQFDVQNSHPAWPFHPKISRQTGRTIIPKRIALPKRVLPSEEKTKSLFPDLISLFEFSIIFQKPNYPPERPEPSKRPDPKIPDQPQKPVPPDFPKPNQPNQPTPPERPDKPYQPNQPDKPFQPDHPSKPQTPEQPVAFNPY